MGQDTVGEGQLYVAVTIREKTHMDPPDFDRFVFTADFDPDTHKTFPTYVGACLWAIHVLTNYALGEVDPRGEKRSQDS